MKHESFIYLWYDAPNKTYYLGKHKGTPDDSYTHSSTLWERFTKDNIPKGVRRRILAYGTDEEMCILEHKLLVNRKKRHWNRYYNESLGDPRYVDTSGENNPMFGKKRPEHTERMSGRDNPSYKNGNFVGWRSLDKEVRSQVNKKINNTPERREYMKKYHAKKKLEKQKDWATLEPYMG